MCPSVEALRIAVDQSRLRITNVAFVNEASAQCTVLVAARDAVVHDNEPNYLWESAAGESQIGTHVPIHRFGSEQGRAVHLLSGTYLGGLTSRNRLHAGSAR